MRLRPLTVVTASLLVAGGAIWFVIIDPAVRYRTFDRDTRAELRALTRKRPPDVTREQWHNVVAWTWNGYGNILAGRMDLPQPERDRFLADLRVRLARPVNLATIDWIWDEYERLNPSYGPVYSSRYRPTTPERLSQFQVDGFCWAGFEVD